MREDIRGGETDMDLYAPVDSLVSPVFAREDRYIVLKRREIRNALTDLEREILISICDKIHDYRCRIMEKPPLECVVVENDLESHRETEEYIMYGHKENCDCAVCDDAMPKSETAWLIELEGPKWMAIIDGEPQWTDDANKALRFARKEDADNLRTWWCITAKSTEHIWCPV